MSSELGDDLRHVGDRRQPVRVERLVERDPGRRVEQPVLRQRVADALDDPALDLARRAEWVDDPADVVDRRDALDADLSRLDVDRDLGDLDAEGQHLHPGRVRAARALAEDLRVLEQPDDLLERPRAAVGGDDVAALERRATRSSLSKRCAAISMICRVASAAAERTAGPIDGVVDEPAEMRGVRPARGVAEHESTRSSGSPSSSAAICAIAVRVPVPMSCIAVTTVARPSEPTRTHA